jgi:predicted nucleic acid-binding protein
MPRSVLLDAGPIVAYLRESETHHAWAAAQFQRFSRFATCEAVLAEACARLAYFDEEPQRVIELVAEADFDVSFQMKPNADRILRLMEKYSDQPMDFADACIVAMSEKVKDCLVVTLDRNDFSVYRRHEREVIPFVAPGR